MAVDPAPGPAELREGALRAIESLAARFQQVHASPRAYRGFNEARTVNEFIQPLFQALGWDVHNRHGGEEVLPEVPAGGLVDWSYRIRGITRFFLEAKRLSADLNDPRWARQAITYAYNKGVTWAVLTNFEELRVYNAEWQETNPERSRFLTFRWDTYAQDIDRLLWLSKPAVDNKVLDREAESVGRRLYRVPVGKSLFEDLIEFRELLVHTFAAYNSPLIDHGAIEHAVQRLLDRLIFMRTTEDRAVDDPHLRSLLRQSETPEGRPTASLWPGLRRLFRDFDEAYDSQLFERQLLDELDIEPEPIQRVAQGLYGTRNGWIEYNFAAIDADVLGGVYEQYLGHIVPPSAGVTRAAREAVSEAGLARRRFRRRQGVYYTPKWVVRYIVSQTIGRQLELRSAAEIRDLRVLDPACGSGSFLIEAFRVLDAYWARQEPLDDPVAVRQRRTRILQENLFGIDLDPQAVEIAQLNLLLVALSDRSLLPDLSRNVRVGNSLVAPSPEVRAYFGDRLAEVRPFDWEALTGEGRFDAIIGNPPYVRLQLLDRQMAGWYLEHYEAAQGAFDLYSVFVERALQGLEDHGLGAFIVPHKFASRRYGAPLRRLLVEHGRIEAFDSLGHAQVFEGVSTYTAILRFRGQSGPPEFQANVLAPPIDGTEPVMEESQRFAPRPIDAPWPIVASRDPQAGTTMGSVARVFVGVQTDADDVYYMDIREWGDRIVTVRCRDHGREWGLEPAAVMKLAEPNVVRHYAPTDARAAVLLPYANVEGRARPWDSTQLADLALTSEYIRGHEERLRARRGMTTAEQYWAFVYPKNILRQRTRKLLVPYLVGPLRVAYDQDGEWCSDNVDVNGIAPRTGSWTEDQWFALLGYLNSEEAHDRLAQVSTLFRGGWIGANKQFLDQLMVPFSLDDEGALMPWATVGRRGYEAGRQGEAEHVSRIRAEGVQ